MLPAGTVADWAVGGCRPDLGVEWGVIQAWIACGARLSGARGISGDMCVGTVANKHYVPECGKRSVNHFPEAEKRQKHDQRALGGPSWLLYILIYSYPQ